ncbi:polysaccharide biosynthesis protein [Oscillochloris trichoides DG-6]|uniref:Polysaccharide biosynthesis protein n=1 Tax=Oscillochloris trichoides DG-6 TaxID=765420 RepID=E1IHW3_9CHLR|nr:flippase [Oscillochloris trichoides]EFO79238.1 polysaccharide biosynthesis protein [Oscillochloris trichoides DG-6]
MRRIIHNTGWLMLDRILRLMAGMLVSFWLARYLGPSAFGSYNYALALSMFVGSVATLGLDTIVVRELVRDPPAAPTILASAALLRFCAGLVAVGLATLAVALLRPAEPVILLLTLFFSLAAPLQAFSTIDLWFQAQVDVRPIVTARTLAFILATLLKLWLLLIHAPILAFAAMFALEALLGAGAALFAYQRRTRMLWQWRCTVAQARSLLTASWPLIFSGLLVTLYLRIDQIMLGQMVGDAEVGLYAAAVRIAEAFPLLPIAIVTSAYPTLVALRQSDPQRFSAQLQRLYALVAALGYASTLTVTLTAPWLLQLLAGPSYAAATPILILLTWAGMFSALGVARTTYLNAENLTHLHTITVLIGAVANVGLNWWLIPHWGGVGAALASLITYWLAAHGTCFLLPQLRPAGRMMTRAMLWPKFW